MSERLMRLRRIFPAAIAEWIETGEGPDPFEWHRRDVTVLFVDLRGFTSFVELSEPEVVVEILRDYYARVAGCVRDFGGTVGHVAGDGIMVLFNDPVEVPDPQARAVRTAIRIREELGALRERWTEMEYSIDFGAGIASGFATVGGIGAEGCWDYSVIGTVANVAARLCSAARGGQILIPQRLVASVAAVADVRPLGAQELKGLHHPMLVHEIVGLRPERGGGA